MVLQKSDDSVAARARWRKPWPPSRPGPLTCPTKTIRSQSPTKTQPKTIRYASLVVAVVVHLSNGILLFYGRVESGRP